jgi:hypothetical protein
MSDIDSKVPFPNLDGRNDMQTVTDAGALAPSDSETINRGPADLEVLFDVPVQVSAMLGRARMPVGDLVGRTLAEVERDLILETLKHCLGNRTHAANILGISIRTLRNKLNEYAADGAPIPPAGGGEAMRGAARRSAPETAQKQKARLNRRAF